MITVACLLWGGWCGEHGIDYVVRLRSMVARHLTIPHRFVCFTDRDMPSFIEVLPMNIPNWHRNLRKTLLYKSDNGLEGRVLALDLDIVIVDSINELADYKGRFCNVEDFYKKGVSGGSIIGFEANTLANDLYYPLAKDPFNIGWKLRGSERMWYRQQMPDPDFWQQLYPGRFINFKYQGQESRLAHLPEGVSVVCFHGRPRPHEVVNDVSWVGEHWK